MAQYDHKVKHKSTTILTIIVIKEGLGLAYKRDTRGREMDKVEERLMASVAVVDGGCCRAQGLWWCSAVRFRKMEMETATTAKD